MKDLIKKLSETNHKLPKIKYENFEIGERVDGKFFLLDQDHDLICVAEGENSAKYILSAIEGIELLNEILPYIVYSQRSNPILGKIIKTIKKRDEALFNMSDHDLTKLGTEVKD